MRFSRLLHALLLCLAVQGACGRALDTAPSAGPPGAPGAASADAFALIQSQLFAPSCATSGCHTGSAPQSGLDLSAATAYAQLVNVPPTNSAARADGLKRVVPGRPDSSLLWHKLIVPPGHHVRDYGNPMPSGTAGLSVGQVEYVRQWIAAGAPRTGAVGDVALLADRTLQSSPPFAPLEVPAPGSGLQLAIGRFDVKSNFERELFTYRPLGNSAPLYVNRIQTRMRPYSHHFLLYTFSDQTPAAVVPPPGVLRDIRNDDGTMNLLNMIAMGYHVFLAGAMTTEFTYTFPAGLALRLPAGTGIDLNVHYANRTAASVAGEAYVNLYTVPASQVTREVSTLNLANTSITIPANQRVTISKTFTFGKRTTLVALTSHMHARGERFVIQLVGGARDGQVVYTNTDWEHPAIVTFAEPLVLEAGQGVRSVVTYNNTTARTISFGLAAEDEMDIIFGYAY